MIRWNNTDPPEFDVVICADNTTWRFSVTLPECPHPVEEQEITEDGVRCGACGKTQPPSESEDLGVEP